MITMHDIEDMTCLSHDEISAIAAHEHLPQLNAAMLAERMMHLHHGAAKVQTMICDEIRSALHADDVAHAAELFVVLRHFMADHPEAARGAE